MYNTPKEMWENGCCGMWLRNLKQVVERDEIKTFANVLSWEENLSMYVASHQKKDCSDLEIAKIALKRFVKKWRRNGE